MTRRGLLTTLFASSLGAKPGLKIVVTGGHPGDPECGCGGAIARYTALGHDVVLLYLNRGEGYCGEAPLSQCAAIRTAEARQACEILKARPFFAGQVDGRSILDAGHYASFADQLLAQRPAIVFTHWPIDRHRDHRAVSSLVVDAWLRSSGSFSLYYYEVAEDTMNYNPSDYVDIRATASVRRGACYAHASQQPDKWYPKQEEITRFRGLESGFAQAEAFRRHRESKPGLLP